MNPAKSFFNIFIFILLFCTSISAFAFSDINQDHPNKVAIDFLKEKGVVNGYDDGTFGPDKTINRAEFLRIVLESYIEKTLNLDEANKGCFQDVQGEWYEDYVCYAYQKDIVSGYDDGLFHPEREINFAEAAKIIYEVSYEDPLKIEPNKLWYKAYVEILSTDLDIPTSVKDFDQKLTRGETAEILWQINKDYVETVFVFFEDDAVVTGEWLQYPFIKTDQYIYQELGVNSYERLDEADSDTFEVVNEPLCDDPNCKDFYAKDKNAIYFISNSEKPFNATNRYEGLHAENFKIIDSQYATDGENIYFGDQLIIGINPDTLVTLSSGEVDPDTFETIDENYVKDKYSVYYTGDLDEAIEITIDNYWIFGSRLEDVDPDGFSVPVIEPTVN